MKVLFVYPDYEVILAHGTRRFRGVEPGGWYSEGLASLSAVLKADGHEVSLYHIVRPVERREFVRRVRDEAPDLVGFSTATRTFPFTRDMAAWIKSELDVPVVVGSYHPTYVPEETIAVPEIDAICLGEGEYPLRELVARLGDGRSFRDVAGLWVKSGGDVVRNGPGAFIENLDDAPLPDYGLFDFAKLQASRIRTAIVVLSRGCPYSCTYCSNKRLRDLYAGRRKPPIRFPSPEASIARLERLREAYPDVAYLNFRDDILPWRGGWLETFAELYTRRINLPFSCNFRANLLTPRVVRILREMGCYQMYFGVESGNERIRNEVLRRRMSRAEIAAAFAACRAEGIKTVAYNMIGLPYEDRACLLDTIKLNAEIKADLSLNPIYHPFPGTDLFDLAVAEGFVPRDYDYREDRYLEQPTLKGPDLAFTLKYFKTFVKLYRRAFARSSPRARARAERRLDRLFLSPLLPRRLLAWLGTWRDRFVEGLKYVMRTRAPRAYLWLRDRVRGISGPRPGSAATG